MNEENYPHHLRVESLYRDRKVREICEKTGENSLQVKAIIMRFHRWMLFPNSIDSERSLVKVYMQAFRKGGQNFARSEVDRRIRLGKEIRKLREMALENGELSLPDAPSREFI